MPQSTIVHTAPKRTPSIASSCHAICRNIRRAPWLQIDPMAAFLAQSWQESETRPTAFGSSQLRAQTDHRPNPPMPIGTPATTEARARTVGNRSFGRDVLDLDGRAAAPAESPIESIQIQIDHRRGERRGQTSPIWTLAGLRPPRRATFLRGLLSGRAAALEAPRLRFETRAAPQEAPQQ